MTRTADAERRAALLEAIVDYAFANGLSDLSLRPLAKAVGSSPRVLLYYFDSKDHLVEEILRGVRARQLAGFAQLREQSFASPIDVCRAVWNIMQEPQHEPLFRLFFEVFGLALQDRERFGGFLHHAIEDWIAFLAAPSRNAGIPDDEARAFATVVLAGFRGFIMDLCATGDRPRLDRAVEMWLQSLHTCFECEESFRAE
jgi:AcrR family transcriptional regulator